MSDSAVEKDSCENDSVFKSKYFQALESTPMKINIDNIIDVRIALDDIMCKYFTDECPVAECFRETDQYIILSILLNLIALVVFGISYKFPFQIVRLYIGALSATYLILLAIMTVYFYYKSVPSTFEGKLSEEDSSKKDTIRFKINTLLKLEDHQYTLNALVSRNSSSKLSKNVIKSITISESIERFFDAEGALDVVNYASFLNGAISTFGNLKFE